VKVPSLTPVDSSNLQAIGFSAAGLFVRFKGGGLYRYPEVPRVVFDRGMDAESKGKWFRAEISGHYKYVTVDEPVDAG